ncbi:ectoine/hydroxyectoine ABC transporter permease subunit EhuC, partial [Mesorhizobium sp. M8A.F.Ca.ET.208.01.1.1]|uniref:ABC transporter permease subunit n=1 Tax=unclassified Mesorhizobium TaxID=325217 RepID=UPI001136319C
MSIFEFLQGYGQAFLQGTLATCVQFLLATLVAVAAAGVAGIGKLSSNWLIRSASVVYIEIFRGTSLLVQLYWIFFVLPLFGITLPNFTAGYISVGLNIGAYG